ncbi:MAG: hypothetical protein BVN35_03750 [Proteobacteria bacterium ST_bin11]|nr:MAG: hypothetical protein BVN35_03750 [Proteobacteria bacterium ST_bin11]
MALIQMRRDVFVTKKCIAKNQEFQGKILQAHFVFWRVTSEQLEVLVSVVAYSSCSIDERLKFNNLAVYSGIK